MKALVVAKPGQLEVRDVPEVPMGEYEARCEMLYGATCTGTDLHVIDGNFAEPVAYPSIIGHESIGRVVEVGAKVRSYKVGDLITRVNTRATDSMKLSWGGMCQYGLACDHRAAWLDGVDPDKWSYFQVNQVIPPELIDPLDATMIITWRETLSFVRRIGVQPGDRVLVSGSGANGISIAAMARLCGASEVLMAGSGSRLQNAVDAGVTAYTDYRDADALGKLCERYQGKIDILVDATGKAGSLNRYMGCIAPGGTVSVYGMDDYNTYHINPLLAGKNSFRVYNGGYYEPETHEEVIRFIREGKLDAGAWLDREHVFTWENAPQAYQFVREKKAIKAVIKLTNG